MIQWYDMSFENWKEKQQNDYYCDFGFVEDGACQKRKNTRNLSSIFFLFFFWVVDRMCGGTKETWVTGMNTARNEEHHNYCNCQLICWRTDHFGHERKNKFLARYLLVVEVPGGYKLCDHHWITCIGDYCAVLLLLPEDVSKICTIHHSSYLFL